MKERKRDTKERERKGPALASLMEVSETTTWHIVHEQFTRLFVEASNNSLEDVTVTTLQIRN